MTEPRREVFLNAQGGDKAAQESLVAFYRPYIARIAKLYHRETRGELDDHIGVALLALVKAMRFYDPKKNDSFARYAAVIVRRDLMTANRKNERRFSKSVFLDEESDMEALSAEDSLDAAPVSDNSEMLQALLAHVNPLVSRATHLIAIERESPREAADQLGISLVTMQWMLQRAARTWEVPGVVESREAPMVFTIVLWGSLELQPTQFALFEFAECA